MGSSITEAGAARHAAFELRSCRQRLPSSSPELARLGPVAILWIDPAAKAITSAQQRSVGLSGMTFNYVYVYDLEPGFGRFDIAVVRGVLHHLAEPDRALKAIASVADEIIFMEPNGCNPVLKLIERFSAYHKAHEEQSFLPSTIDRWLRDAGKASRRREIINLVPLFCPPWFAKLLKVCEPIVERIPLARLIACGQYIVKAG
jgi:SAM-dependent methyltransferase